MVCLYTHEHQKAGGLFMMNCKDKIINESNHGNCIYYKYHPITMKYYCKKEHDIKDVCLRTEKYERK